MRKQYHRVFPVTKAFINQLRDLIRQKFGIDVEENMTDRAVLETAEQEMSKIYIDAVFHNSEYLSEEEIIEY